MKDLLSWLGFYDIPAALKKFGSALIDFENYNAFMWGALVLGVALLVFGIVLLCKEDYRKQGILSVICAVANTPFLICALGQGLGSIMVISLAIMIILFIIVQCVSDSDKFSGHCFILGEIWIVSVIVAAFFYPETKGDHLVFPTIMGQSVPVAIFITDIVAIIHTSDGFIFANKKRSYSYSSSSSSSYSGGYSSDYTNSSTRYQNIHDARAELKYKLDSRYLSPSEKQALIKEHNDKYLDAVNYDNGVYSNVYEH